MPRRRVAIKPSQNLDPTRSVASVRSATFRRDRRRHGMRRLLRTPVWKDCLRLLPARTRPSQSCRALRNPRATYLKSRAARRAIPSNRGGLYFRPIVQPARDGFGPRLQDCEFRNSRGGKGSSGTFEAEAGSRDDRGEPWLARWLWGSQSPETVMLEGRSALGARSPGLAPFGTSPERPAKLDEFLAVRRVSESRRIPRSTGIVVRGRGDWPTD